MAKKRLYDIELPADPRDIELPADPRADLVNWPSPATHGPGLPMPTSRDALQATIKPPQPSVEDAIKVLRTRFRGFEPADPRFEQADQTAPVFDDPSGALALHGMRDIRAGELADRLGREEATAFLPQEGYEQGSPGRRTRSNASGVMQMLLDRSRLEGLGAEMAADPFTGASEQDRVQGVQAKLDEAATTRRPELTDAADAVSSRNAFGDFLKKKKGYEAEISEPGKAALDAASARKVAESKALAGSRGGIRQIQDPNNPGHKIWVSAADAIGQSAGMPATEAVRVNSAQTVLDTRDDILKQLHDPNVASQLGIAMGRYNTMRDFIGNPPPELSRLAGQIESFTFANMGVHGMRSARAANEMKKMFDQHHTPESLIQAIDGISEFSGHFIANATGQEQEAVTVKMKAPDGSEQDVPVNDVEHFKKLGATVVQ